MAGRRVTGVGGHRWTGELPREPSELAELAIGPGQKLIIGDPDSVAHTSLSYDPFAGKLVIAGATRITADSGNTYIDLVPITSHESVVLQTEGGNRIALYGGMTNSIRISHEGGTMIGLYSNSIKLIGDPDTYIDIAPETGSIDLYALVKVSLQAGCLELADSSGGLRTPNGGLVDFSYSGTNLRIPLAAVASPSAGTMYFDTATATLYIHDGSAWKSVTLT